MFIVLLSAGLDSTYNLYRAREEGKVSLAITFDYGQKAAAREISRAQAMCQKLKIPHSVIDLSFFKQFQSSSLLNPDLKIPQGEEVQMDDLNTSQQTAKRVWVPNRNGIFLNVGAGFAEALGARYVVPGFNKEEAVTFPDNSDDFIQVLNKSFVFSTANHVEVKCYSAQLDKTEIVRELKKREFDFSDVWPCYESGEKICGRCESCQRFGRALQANGVK